MIATLAAFVAGLVAGGTVVFVWRGTTIHALEREVTMTKEAAELRHNDAMAHYQDLLSTSASQQAQVETVFKAAAADVLSESARQYQEVAAKDLRVIRTETAGDLERGKLAIEASVRELKDQLQSANQRILTFERERSGQYAKIEANIAGLRESETTLSRQTQQLRDVLSTSSGVRGQWGEAVLENLLQSAGLVSGVDYVVQAETIGEDGERLRPDVIVSLPASGKKLIIDAKTSLFEDLRENGTPLTEEELAEQHSSFARRLRSRVADLSGKSYSEWVDAAAPFVLMFVPSEAGIRAAFDADRELFHWAMDRRVLITSPATVLPLILLLAQLREQVSLSQNTERLRATLEELGKRISRFFDHLAKVQRGLRLATDGWNDAVSKSWLGRQSIPQSLEKVRDLGGTFPETDEPEPIGQPLPSPEEALHAVSQREATQRVDALANLVTQQPPTPVEPGAGQPQHAPTPPRETLLG